MRIFWFVAGVALTTALIVSLGLSPSRFEVGRYQIALRDGGETYVLDTQTGQVWDYSRIGNVLGFKCLTYLREVEGGLAPVAYPEQQPNTFIDFNDPVLTGQKNQK